MRISRFSVDAPLAVSKLAYCMVSRLILCSKLEQSPLPSSPPPPLLCDFTVACVRYAQRPCHMQQLRFIQYYINSTQFTVAVVSHNGYFRLGVVRAPPALHRCRPYDTKDELGDTYSGIEKCVDKRAPPAQAYFEGRVYYLSIAPPPFFFVQVFASIQTLVLVKDPYYNEGKM